VGLRHLRLKWTRKKAYRLRHHRSRYLLFGTAGAWADYVFAYDCRKQMNKEAVRRLRSGYTATCWDTKLKTETHYELEAGKLVPRSISGPSDSDFESKVKPTSGRDRKVKCKRLDCPNPVTLPGQAYCCRDHAPYGHLCGKQGNTRLPSKLVEAHPVQCRCGVTFLTRTSRRLCRECQDRLELDDKRKLDPVVKYRAFQGAEHNRPSTKKKDPQK